jgi:hypothetical protein
MIRTESLRNPADAVALDAWRRSSFSRSLA